MAAIILLLIKPTELFEPSWQLSFAAVLGIILFTDRIAIFLYERTIEQYWNSKTPKTKIFFRIIPKHGLLIVYTFAVSFAACLASSGILLYHFYTINYLTWLWTVIVSPLIVVISVIGYLKIIIALVLPTIANFLGIIAIVLSDVLIWLIKSFASWHISEVLIGSVPLVVIVLYYGFIFFAVYARINRPLLKKAIVTVMFSAIILFLGVSKWQRVYRDNLIVTALDVGHGQAIFAQLPGKTNILFDAGSLLYSDIGRKIVGPFLNYNGIGTIDAIIISHGDIDHINGIPEIAEYNRRIGGVYADGAVFLGTDPCGPPKVLKTFLAKIGIEIQPLKQNFDRIKILLDPNFVSIQILWPDKQTGNDEKLSSNDKSVVSLIEFAGRKILLCSDIEKPSQKKLITLRPQLKTDIVVVPHHGSIRTLDDSFLENLNAGILIASCSESSYEKGQVIGPRQGLKSYYTGRDGAITVRIDKNGDIKTDTFLK